MTLFSAVTRFSTMATVCLAVHVGAAHASPVYVTVDVSGTSDMDERGAESNTVRDLSIGAGATIESLKWAINLTSYDPSYLSEMQLTFSDSLGNGVTFTPGGGDDFEGTNSYAGFQDLRLLGQQFQLGDDGLLRLEFHDAYKDLAFDEPEGMWNFGSLTFGVSTVPEPQVLSLMLVALVSMLGVARWRSSTAQRA
ncbi:hypothetical protein ASF44_18860 [Pseudorhodoferax sp. Leaf274]|nr:hypothetical protein ASF44_18860 [Pseudorhodoferax sp. Leaf274]